MKKIYKAGNVIPKQILKGRIRKLYRLWDYISRTFA